MKHLIFFVLVLFWHLNAKAQVLNEHTVSTGESLQAIASKYGVSISELRNANSGLDDYVFAGMVLRIPSRASDNNQIAVLPIDDLKDIIYLKDGSEVVAKILSIEPDGVKFEQYDTDDPFVILKMEIASIKFEDGSVSDYTIQETKKTTTNKRMPTTKKTTR